MGFGSPVVPMINIWMVQGRVILDMHDQLWKSICLWMKNYCLLLLLTWEMFIILQIQSSKRKLYNNYDSMKILLFIPLNL
jgi:hypothetical protein